MDAAHIHLISNHVPLLATIFSLLILVWGLFKSEKRYQNLAMVGFIIAGVFSIIALQSGEGAEDIVENLPGVAESFIHNHEEAAETTNWIAIILALASLGGFVVRRLKPMLIKTYLWILLVGSLLSASMFSYTAYLGGQIRHTEIRPDTSATQTQLGDEYSSKVGNTTDK
jgi:uncharacterized membrane protein